MTHAEKRMLVEARSMVDTLERRLEQTERRLELLEERQVQQSRKKGIREMAGRASHG